MIFRRIVNSLINVLKSLAFEGVFLVLEMKKSHKEPSQVNMEGSVPLVYF